MDQDGIVWTGRVKGILGSENELYSLLCKSNAQKHIVYFPGDIQDLEKNMRLVPKSDEWLEYSLERTAELLYQRFNMQCNIWIVRPTRSISGFSEYDNLLRPGLGICDLEETLLKSFKAAQNTHGISISQTLPLVFIGFSKGVLVLNQILAELSTAVDCDITKGPTPPLIYDWEAPNLPHKLPSHEPSRRIARTRTIPMFVTEHRIQILNFFQNVESMHWLDGHRFPTEPQVIQTAVNFLSQEEYDVGQENQPANSLKKLSTQTFIHTTPRQVRDKNRKWIAGEYNIFLQELKNTNLTPNKLHILQYYENEPSSLENHFKILTSFKTS